MNEHTKPAGAVDSSWSDLDAAVDFLRLLRPEGPWNLTAIAPDVAGAESATFTDATRARTWLKERVGRANLHYMPNPAPKPTGAAGRAKKGDVRHTEFRSVDIDLDKLPPRHEWFDFDLEERKSKMVERLHGFKQPGPPSIIVDSGGGLQPLWRLDAPSNVRPSREDERQNEMLCQLLGGDIGTHNIDRLLRLPGTPNLPDAKKRKRGRVPAPAKLVEQNQLAYPIASFAATGPRKAVASDETQVDPAEYVPDLDAVATQYGLSERVVEIIRDGRLTKPKDGDDSRSGWLFDAVCELARSGVPTAIIMGIITDERWAVAASVLERGQDADRYAEHQVQGAMQVILAERRGDFLDDASPGAEPTTAPDKYRRLGLLDLLELPSPKWLVKDWITEGGLFGMFGGEKSYKTFLLLDMFLRAATGMDWHGIPMMKSRVQYVIGEGNARRFADRIVAWCIHNKVPYEAVNENFKVVPVRVGVDNDAERRAFIDADHSLYDVTIFDTMARNMDGDENATRDMSKTISAIDEIRAVYHSAGGFAHHTGKDVTKGARGSSALAGAVDALIEVKHNQATGEALVTLYRSRDSEQGVSRVFKPKRVVVSGDEFDGEARHSLVMEFVREGSKDDQKAAATTVTGEAKTAADKILVYLAENNGVVAQKELESDAHGMSHANVNKAFLALRKGKLINGTGPIFVTKKGTLRAMELGAVLDADIDR